MSISNHPDHYVGLSSEVWPTDIPDGSTLHLVDTGEEFICYGGIWVPDRRLIHTRSMQEETLL